MAAPSMNAIADQYAHQGVGSIFLYTHEAHPGEYYPHLTSMEQKFRHATALRDVLVVTRPIYIDALDGACHRNYGSMPNMSWIFTRSGVPVYKSDWTDSHSVQNAIEYFLQVAGRRREGERMAPFRVERLDYRIQDQKQFYAGLERNGPKAVREFRETFG
jgi:hypothetical protein